MVCRDRQTAFLPGLKAGVSCLYEDELYLEIKKIQETMVRREDLDALLDTIEILSNPETMATIQASEEDIAAGRYREISSIDDLLGELSRQGG